MSIKEIISIYGILSIDISNYENNNTILILTKDLYYITLDRKSGKLIDKERDLTFDDYLMITQLLTAING